MADTIVVIAAGEMGSGISRRLTERGARVPTSLKGRGAGNVVVIFTMLDSRARLGRFRARQ